MTCLRPFGSVMMTFIPSTETSNPGGRNVLNAMIRLGRPRNKRETRFITPGVSILKIFHAV